MTARIATVGAETALSRVVGQRVAMYSPLPAKAPRQGNKLGYGRSGQGELSDVTDR